VEEAAQVYRRLAEADRVDGPFLVDVLRNVAVLQSDLGLREEALAVWKEVVRVYRRLAIANPAVFEPRLAGALNNLGLLLSDRRRGEEAVAVWEEVVQIYRPLANANPALFEPTLTLAQRAMSTLLLSLGRPEEAAAADRMGSLYRDGDLARQNGLAFVLLLRDEDDARGLARLLLDVRLPESEVKAAVPPVRGPEFFTAPGLRGWLGENAPADAAVIYVLDHEAGLADRLHQVPGIFYVGVPESSASKEYGDSVRSFPAKSPLDFATVIMSDYSLPVARPGIVFDPVEAIRMGRISAYFPANLENPTDYGYPADKMIPRHPRAAGRSAYRHPGRPAWKQEGNE
jgi:tetratricopeptide (TPR) repeat protein